MHLTSKPAFVRGHINAEYGIHYLTIFGARWGSIWLHLGVIQSESYYARSNQQLFYGSQKQQPSHFKLCNQNQHIQRI